MLMFFGTTLFGRHGRAGVSAFLPMIFFVFVFVGLSRVLRLLRRRAVLTDTDLWVEIVQGKPQRFAWETVLGAVWKLQKLGQNVSTRIELEVAGEGPWVILGPTSNVGEMRGLLRDIVAHTGMQRIEKGSTQPGWQEMLSGHAESEVWARAAEATPAVVVPAPPIPRPVAAAPPAPAPVPAPAPRPAAPAPPMPVAPPPPAPEQVPVMIAPPVPAPEAAPPPASLPEEPPPDAGVPPPPSWGSVPPPLQ